MDQLNNSVIRGAAGDVNMRETRGGAGRLEGRGRGP